MKLFLAGTCSRDYLVTKYKPLYVLESFYYIQDWQIKEIPKWNMFLLDSGAFTFMSNTKKDGVDFYKYLDDYINFINKYDIKHFFELDIDKVVGYDEVLKMRKILETKTNKKCIPVWHKSRGIKEFEKMCSEYDYVAIGGLVTKEIKKSEFPALKKMTMLAKQYGTKVHGLGFTNNEAYKYGFYSVDSTNWLSSSRFGGVEYFNGQHMVKVSTPKGKKSIHYKLREEFILQEYIKYQKYADKFL